MTAKPLSGRVPACGLRGGLAGLLLVLCACAGGPHPETTIEPQAAVAPPMASASAAFQCSKCVPTYPLEARRAGQEGTTRIALTVDAAGSVISTTLLVSSGSDQLDQAAIQALALCPFKPARKNGVAVEGKAVIEYVWKLMPADPASSSAAAGNVGTVPTDQ